MEISIKLLEQFDEFLIQFDFSWVSEDGSDCRRHQTFITIQKTTTVVSISAGEVSLLCDTTFDALPV